MTAFIVHVRKRFDDLFVFVTHACLHLRRREVDEEYAGLVMIVVIVIFGYRLNKTLAVHFESKTPS